MKKEVAALSEYQRFVSYLYEYQNNIKKQNCGFTRVEVRNHTCKLEIHMKLPACPFTPSFQVYAFLPQTDGLLGISLGKASYQYGTVYASFRLPDENIGGFPCNFQDLGGLFIQSDNGQTFATAWKELTIKPDSFFLPENQSLTKPQNEIAENPPQEIQPQIQAASLENTSQPTVEPYQQELFDRYPQVHPFFDDEIHNCIQLSPADINDLQQYSLYIGNNPFINHSEQTYHHILLGKMDHLKANEFVLAIPGIYDEKERFLAAMFGFPNFKPAQSKVIQPGQFGYWYRILY